MESITNLLEIAIEILEDPNREAQEEIGEVLGFFDLGNVERECQLVVPLVLS